MKKFVSRIFLMLLGIFLVSCNLGNSDAMYFAQQARHSQVNTISGEEEWIEEEDDDLPEITSEDGTKLTLVKPDPFKNWDDESYNNFIFNPEEWVIHATFDGQNKPTYKFSRGGGWYSFDASRNGDVYNQPASVETRGQGYLMENVKYYRYHGKNPNFNGSNPYNLSDKLNRFYFYTFQGEAAKQKTANHLIAVDKMTKLVFAFSVPTGWKEIVGKYAPTGWGSVEAGWYADTNNKRNKFAVTGLKYFYEYDPVGIVHNDGRVELYGFFTDGIARNNYAPRFAGELYDESRPIATYSAPGRSPYMPLKPYYVNEKGERVDVEDVEPPSEENKPTHQMKITMTGIGVKNIDTRTANRYAIDGFLGYNAKTGDMDANPYDHAQIATDFKFGVSAGMETDGVLSVSKIGLPSSNPILGYIFGSGPSRDDDNLKVGVGNTHWRGTQNNSRIITYQEGDEIGIDMFCDVIKYDEPKGNVTNIEWPYEYALNNGVGATFTYDADEDKFKFSSITDSYNRVVRYYIASENGNEIEYRIVIDGKDGEPKPVVNRKYIFVPYSLRECGGNPTGYNNQIELIFKFKYEKMPDPVK